MVLRRKKYQINHRINLGRETQVAVIRAQILAQTLVLIQAQIQAVLQIIRKIILEEEEGLRNVITNDTTRVQDIVAGLLIILMRLSRSQQSKTNKSWLEITILLTINI